MFIDIDYNKKNLKAKYYLAKPNKQIIGHIDQKMSDTLNLKLGNVSEVNFTIPYQVRDENDEVVTNKYVNLIREKMLIKMKIGAESEWFIVQDIAESSEEESFTVTAYGLGYELKHKLISILEIEEASAMPEIINQILSTSIWSVGFMDDKFTNIYRTFSESSTNVLDCVIKLAETFGALIVWDTVKRQVNFYDPDTYGVHRGLVFNNRLLEDASVDRSSEEQMITKLYAYGEDNLTFSEVNPTGNPYLEDYSYFMYPFQQDSSGNVIKSSYYMSDELCKSIVEYNALTTENETALNDYMDAQLDYILKISTAETELENLNLELDNILDRLDVAKATENQTLITSITKEEIAKRLEISNKTVSLKNLNTAMSNNESAYISLKESISKEANFTPELLNELNIFEIEATFEDSDIIDPVDLFNEAKVKFESLKVPNKTVNISTINLFNVVEEQFYWDKLVLGDYARVKDDILKLDYKSMLLEITYDFEEGEAELTFSDDPSMVNQKSKLQEILYDAQNTSTVVNDNRYRWNEINVIGKNVSDMINSAWDANKQQITAGINNSIDIGKRGIVITNPDRPDEIIIMQSGIVALSKDKGVTWTTAITPSGVNAEVIMGRMLIGESLVIASEGNTFQLDANGARFDANYFEVTSSSGGNKVDEWDYTVTAIEQAYDDNVITPYEKKMLKIEWGKLLTKYNGLVERADGFYYPNSSDLFELIQYEEKYTNLYNYLFTDTQGTGKPILDPTNMKQATVITRTEYQKVFDEFYESEENLATLLSQRAKELIELNAEALNVIRDEVKNVLDDVPYWIELTSTKGSRFSNGNIDTRFIAKLYKGSKEVTALLPVDSFIWSKRDKDGIADTAWNTAHVNVGNTVDITRDDVYRKAIFGCAIWFDSDLIAT